MMIHLYRPWLDAGIVHFQTVSVKLPIDQTCATNHGRHDLGHSISYLLFKYQFDLWLILLRITLDLAIAIQIG